MMRAPSFWFRPPEAPGLTARLLSPLGLLTARLTAARVARLPEFTGGPPVICIGNLVAGGSGKTPTVMAMAERLMARGAIPHIISRGHGGRLTGPLRVDPSTHLPSEVGDEPLLLANLAPTWVSRNRAAGARAAAAAGAGVILLDDGFQNPTVAKSLSIVVADAETGFGNGRCLPAGPLREPVAAGLARADLLLTLGDAKAQALFAARWSRANAVPCLTGALRPLSTGMSWRGLQVLAFAGIGRPEKFFATLAGEGAEIARAVPLADHQPLSAGLLARLQAEAQGLGAQLVTTEKDAMRLPLGWRGKVLVLPVRLALDDWAPIDAALTRLGL